MPRRPGAQVLRFAVSSTVCVCVCVCVSLFPVAKKGLLRKRKERDLERDLMIIRVQGCGKGKQGGNEREMGV